MATGNERTVIYDFRVRIHYVVPRGIGHGQKRGAHETT